MKAVAEMSYEIRQAIASMREIIVNSNILIGQPLPKLVDPFALLFGGRSDA